MMMITMMMMLTMMTMIEVDIEIIVGSSSRQNRHRSNGDGGSTGLFLPTSIPTTSMLPARVAIVQLFNYFKTTVFYFSFSLPFFAFSKLNEQPLEYCVVLIFIVVQRPLQLYIKPFLNYRSVFSFFKNVSRYFLCTQLRCGPWHGKDKHIAIL